MNEANNNSSAKETNHSDSLDSKLTIEFKSVATDTQEKEKEIGEPPWRDSITQETREIDWHKLAHRLREHNRKLLKKVFQLEQDIQESNQTLAEQIEQSRSKDLYTARQAEKINQYQEEIAQLQQQIAIERQENSTDRVLKETLTQQLETSQQQVTKLEEESRELQIANEAKDRELLEKKQQIQELNTRFQRQQQHLLQYKANNPQTNTSQPIQAWSANSLNTAPTKSPLPHSFSNPDWSASESTSASVPSPKIPKTEIAPRLTRNKKTKTPNSIDSIAAVKLPKFTRHVENEKH